MPVKRLEQTIKGTGIIIHLSKLWVKSNFEKNKNIKVAFAGPLLKRKIKSDITFRFGEGEDRSGLVSYVKKTGAKKIALCPKIDNKTVRLFLKHGFEVYKVNTPRQMLMGY